MALAYDQALHDSRVMTTTYTISDLAREFDVTTRTIRFYEDEGLLSPERQGQARIYSPRDRVLLKLILRGKRLGFSLAECRELFDLYKPEEGNITQLQRMLDKLAGRRAAMEQQLNDIKVMQLELDAAEQRIRDALTETLKNRSEAKA
jgi:DNA-binding transcriptional MerR regulator